MAINYNERIPNNVDLSDNRRLQRALEAWQPSFLDWWGELGPEGTKNFDIYLRTAISVEPEGWANYDYVKMPDYRWGIFVNPLDPDKKIGFGPTRRALSRIAKEGRKYGVFLGLVTQRPAEIDPTIISQCSTLFVMRPVADCLV